MRIPLVPHTTDIPSVASSVAAQVSKTVLRRCMRTLPALRDKLMGAFAAFVVRIQEDHAPVIKDSLELLLRCGM